MEKIFITATLLKVELLYRFPEPLVMPIFTTFNLHVIRS